MSRPDPGDDTLSAASLLRAPRSLDRAGVQPLARVGMAIVMASAILHVFMVLRSAADLPFWDDYDAILQPLVAYRRHGDLTRLLFAPHNEHIVFWVRAVSALQWYVLGRVDFVGLVCVGEGFLLATFLLWLTQLLHAARQQPQATESADVEWLLAATGAVCFLNASYWASSLWALACLSNFPVLFFSYAAFIAIDRVPGSRGVWLAGLCATLALASQAGGLFAFFVVAAMLVQKKPRGRLVVWLLVCAVASGSYVALRLAYPNGVALQPQHGSLAQTAGFFFAFLGSLFHQRWLALGLGASLLALLALAVTSARPHARGTTSLGLFVLLCALAAALNRSRLGLSEAIASRYAVCSSLLVLVVLLAHGRLASYPRVVHVLLLVSAVALNLTVAVRAAPHVAAYRHGNHGLVREPPACVRAYHHYDAAMAATIYADAVSAGIYRAPSGSRVGCDHAEPPVTK